MQIPGTEGLSPQQIDDEISRGGKFVIYLYTISILVMSWKRSSSVRFIKAGESAAMKGLGYTLLTLVAGWWGIPWGPIFSLQSLFSNLNGGENVTMEVWQGRQLPPGA